MTNIQLLIERYVDCYNRMDFDAMLECVADDVVFENISNHGESMCLQGKDAMRQVAELGMQAFSYRRQAIAKLICGDGSAAAEVRFTGTAALDLPNGVLRGETVEVRGVTIFEIRNGLLSRIADYS